MTTSTSDLLSQEWTALHQDHERYDRYGLLIKLCAVLVCLIALGLAMSLWLAAVFVLVLWLQEGIWRTVQARSSDRLLAIEKMLAASGDQTAMQFYSTWEATRPGTIGLIKAYLLNAMRPTVAYPYVILLGIDAAVAIFMR
ncbi:MAG TPA: hypothetical protein ENJ65_07155 [Candidatus Tenderia electrophaga]|uniref:Uncharacterized protein n=1 Tax=Candidatus Tenderia electrophaga TaxID=1748243 RepID=A0A832N786_9GAMM|nr:hypothetical protein [Candidatus Tenderia electrophaga]